MFLRIDFVFFFTALSAQDAEKTLKSLKSNSQPMVKKRQLMQLSFGDYRRKMADEEKKLRVGQYQLCYQNQSNALKMKSVVRR